MIHTTDILKPEREKYEEIWSLPDYHEFSPGMENVERFMEVIKPKKGDSLIDIGCGTGKAGLAFQDKGLAVWWADLTDSVLDTRIDRRRFIKGPVWGCEIPRRRYLGWDYGFCCDVLEHIPPEFTMLVLDRIIRVCRTSWLQIAFEPDSFGALIGKPLHLTVQSFDWWRDRISLFGELTEARDLCGVGLFVVKR